MTKQLKIKASVFGQLINIFNTEEKILEELSQKDIVIFSHLRWEFVTQRPQHISSYLSKNRRVMFVEEPVEPPSRAIMPYRTFQPIQNVLVVQPFSNAPTDGYDYTSLIQHIIDSTSFTPEPILWFYSPMFINILHYLDASLIVYDCMDKLSAFKNAPSVLEDYEKLLLSLTDIVFTGGKSLYENLKQYHSNVFCFPSSVEASHFRKSLDPETILPFDLLDIPAPRVGYYGVIDERMDIELIAKTANMLPHVSFVFIGPVVKIDPSILPKMKNIHYLGEKPYESLPNYLKGIDIAFIPFMQNESTRFISPTKTLEYMAAVKPIISTPIYDVVRDYSEMVRIVTDASSIKKAVGDFLNENSKERMKRIKQQEAVIALTSWKNTVEEMEEIMARIIEEKIQHNSNYKQSAQSVLHVGLT